MEMAWGIIMTAFTLFGMLALVVASVTMDDTTTRISMNEETGPGSFPQEMQAATGILLSLAPLPHQLSHIPRPFGEREG